MKIKMTVQEFDETVNSIRYKYKLIAPVSIPYAGQYSDTDVIKKVLMKLNLDVSHNLQQKK